MLHACHIARPSSSQPADPLPTCCTAGLPNTDNPEIMTTEEGNLVFKVGETGKVGYQIGEDATVQFDTLQSIDILCE